MIDLAPLVALVLSLPPIPQASDVIEQVQQDLQPPQVEALRSPEPTSQAQSMQTLAPEATSSTEPPRVAIPVTYKPVLACIRHYESTDDYTAVNPSGKYRNGYQMDRDFWITYGGAPEYAGQHEHAPPQMQDRVAIRGLKARGLQPWPSPRKQCGHLLP